VIELGAVIAIGVAFLGGIVSFASPCCLPLVPAYVSYMVGTQAGERPDRRRALAHGLAFTTGFSIVFVAFWASIGAVGYVLADNAAILRQIGGVLVIVLGLQVAGLINIQALWRDVRPMPAMGGFATASGMSGAMSSGGGIGGAAIGKAAANNPSYRRSLLLGTFFAAGWSPCIGPILGGIIGLASATASVVQGTVLLVAYSAGLALPFLAVALGASWVSTRLTWVGRHYRAVSLATGAMLVMIGFLMLTNLLGRLAAIPSPFGG
jgi:cytochrome c-type biogenesis protein